MYRFSFCPRLAMMPGKPTTAAPRIYHLSIQERGYIAGTAGPAAGSINVNGALARLDLERHGGRVARNPH